MKKTKNGDLLVISDDTLEGTANEGIHYRDFVKMYLGRELPDNSVIHHKNRKRQDNNMNNLLLVPSQSLHMYIHSLIKSENTPMVKAFEDWLTNWMLLIKENPKKTALDLLLISDKKQTEKYEIFASKNKSEFAAISEYSYAIQYSKFKVQYADKIVFIQKGNYYCCYGEDAKKMNQLLGWNLFFEDFMNVYATGCPVQNATFENNLTTNNISYVLVDQTETRTKKLLDRIVIKVV